MANLKFSYSFKYLDIDSFIGSIYAYDTGSRYEPRYAITIRNTGYWIISIGIWNFSKPYAESVTVGTLDSNYYANNDPYYSRLPYYFTLDINALAPGNSLYYYQPMFMERNKLKLLMNMSVSDFLLWVIKKIKQSFKSTRRPLSDVL